MVSLIIDLSTERGIVGIGAKGVLIEEIQLPFGLHNSSLALPQIREMFREKGLKVEEIDEVIVGKGPGSYTGIRVGASIAISLSFALKVPLIGVSSLQAFVPNSSEPFIAVIDAKMGGVYASINGGMPKVMSLDELKDEAQAISLFVTPNAEMLKKKLSDDSLCFIERAPSAKKMLELSTSLFAEKSQDGSLDLLYLQDWKPS